MSNTYNPTSNLQLTRKQLDDLDVLVQKMLNLPDANIPAPPQKAEPDFSSMGIFSPGDAPWEPKKIEPGTSTIETSPVFAQIPKENKPDTPQSILNRQPPSKLEEVQTKPQASSEPLSGWKPSPLTWAPLAQSWEKLRQEELEKQQKEIKQPQAKPDAISSETPKTTPLQIKQDSSTNKGSIAVNYSAKSEPIERKKRSKLKTVLLDAIGFLGILIFVCAAALYLSSAFGWPMK